MAAPIGAIPFDDIVRQIRQIGPENAVLSTDLGQAGNPIVPDGFATGVERFRAAGFSEREIDLMVKRNPAHILGLE